MSWEACQLPHSSGVLILPIHTDLWISHMPYENTFLSKASSILAVVLSTEVALDKSHWEEETKTQKLNLPSSMRPQCSCCSVHANLQVFQD